MMRASILYVASLAAHGALAVGVISLRAGRTHETVAISVVESKKPKPAETSPPPPPPPQELDTPKPKAKAARPSPPKNVADPAPDIAPSSDTSSVPDFGLALSGDGATGLAVPPARTATPAPSNSPERVSKKVLSARAKAADECADAPKKPKVVSITQPAYTAEARDAQIAGKIRVEVTVDASGKVATARVLDGLGHGLDDAALAAARSATFEPGTKCGKPVSATFVVAIRFAL